MGPKGTPGSQYVPKVLNDTEEECEYFFENGGRLCRLRIGETHFFSPSAGLRKVRPYFYTFQSYAKSRWLGRSLIEVMRREFHDLSEPYYVGRLGQPNRILRSYRVRENSLKQSRPDA